MCVQEELAALVQIYERRGHFDEILSLLEAALSLERAHVRLSICILLNRSEDVFVSDGHLH